MNDLKGYTKTFEVGDCFCCGHDRESHTMEGDLSAMGPCIAELFNVTETILADCPCGGFIETVPEREE